ncbi:hypothetical protein TIFTF001_003971 [Ficus carica]|uniref:Uncharacterized protein n=1 Tax=Ficus carica TaxID=3494 RepID=A0AA87ZH35_FICCA|nr:hypothetical protein TIFTF001_003971 [Ficus carica]
MWVPRGPRLYAVSSRTPWASPAKGQQCLSEWLAAGGDLTCDGSWCNFSRALPSTPSSDHPGTRFRQLSSPRPNECSQHGGDPSREGCPVVGDDWVINISPPASLGWLRPGMHVPDNWREVEPHVVVGGKTNQSLGIHAARRAGRGDLFTIACKEDYFAESCRKLSRIKSRQRVFESYRVRREGKEFFLDFEMSDVTDFENETLSGSVDVTGDSDLGSSPSTSSSSSSGTPVTPSSRHREGAARLEEILRVGAGTRPDSLFIRELCGAAPEPPVQANPTDVASERSAGQTSTSGREGTESSDSPDPTGEPLDDRDRPEGLAMRINNQRVYRRSDQEMAELAGGFPVYSVDFYTSAVTPGYLAALRRDFQIPTEVDLRVPGKNDLPSRPPPGYISLSVDSAERERLSHSSRMLHPLGQELRYRAAFLGVPKLVPDEVSPLVGGLLLFSGVQGDVCRQVSEFLQAVQGPRDIPERLCVDSGAAYTGDDPEHGEGASESGRARARPEDAAGPVQPIRARLAWLHVDIPDAEQPEPEPVTVARMPEPIVHYRSWSTAAPAEVAPDQSETRGVALGVSASQLPPSDTSPGSWGPRIADEDFDLVIRRLSPVRGQRPARGLRIEEPMADRRVTKRPTDEDRRERLAKMANLGKGKGKIGTSTPPSQNVAPSVTGPALVPSAPAIVVVATPTPAPQSSRPPGFSRDERQPARPDVRKSRTREDRPSQPPAPRSARGESRLDPASLPPGQAHGQSSSAYRALVAKFEERLSVELAESSKRSDTVQAANDGVNKQIEALCIMLSGYAAAKSYANHMADEVKAANTDARHARRAEKEARAAKEAAEEVRKGAEDKAKAVEEAEISKAELEEALRKAEQELASARAEHERYVRAALPAALEVARAQAVADFLRSEDYNERVAQMYREGMRDMKAGFTAANPSLVRVDWSFVLAESEETVAEDPPEEGEVTGAARDLEDIIVLDDQVTETEPPLPAEPAQAAATAEPEPGQLAMVVAADQEQPEPPAA